MKAIVIDDQIKIQKERNRKYQIPFIWLTTQKHPKEQKKRGDKEPFIYLPSTKKQRGVGPDASNH